MSHRPPPFAALRALEAACRHRSYTAAAAELNVTHSAVSQAIRRLEEEVGAKLFHRRGSHMEPAVASLTLAQAYADASRSVSRALRHISESAPNSVTIAAPAQIARLWLTPLLAEVAEAFPDLSLRLRTDRLDDVEVDLTIQFGPAPSGLASERLAETKLLAFAAPGLLRLYRVAAPEDLLRVPLLVDGQGEGWASWFDAAGVEMDGAAKGLRFDDASGLGLDAAVGGLGVALCDPVSAARFVDRGELAPVCPTISAPGPTIVAAWRPQHPKAGIIQPLAEWLAGRLIRGDGGAAAQAFGVRSAQVERLRA